GYPLALWTPEQRREHLPLLNPAGICGAVYSSRDRQIHPAQFTQALVAAAQQRGVTFHLNCNVRAIQYPLLQTDQGTDTADWIVIASGLGSRLLSPSPLPMIPVLGQAIKIQCASSLLPKTFQPVVNGNDIHLVPLGKNQYWIGATVEFPPQAPDSSIDDLIPKADSLQTLLNGAIAYCPALAQGTVIEQWSGLRPRPQGQPAPVIQPVEDNARIILATGHYRNGVLLAPATALTVKSMLHE
ncbi:MAG: FAD-dependent oxidoreductase, partial [Cyanobacteria bacterium P01_D01_bin.128]